MHFFFCILTFSLFLALPLRAAESPPRLIVPSSHGAEIVSVVSTSDGKWILSGSKTREVKLWDATAAKEMGMIVAGKAGEESLVGLYPRNDKEVYAVSTRTLQIYAIPSLRLTTSIDLPHDTFTAAVSADGEAIYLGGAADRKQYVYVLRRGRFPVRKLFERGIEIDTGYIRGGAHLSPHISNDGKFFFYPDKAFQVVNLATQETVLTLPGTTAVNSSEPDQLGWTPDNLLAHYRTSGNDPGTTVVTLYDPASALKVATHSLPSRTSLIKTGHPGTTSIFAGANGFCFLTKSGFEGPFVGKHRVSSGAFAAEGRRFISAGSELDDTETYTNQIRAFDRANAGFSDRWSPTNLTPRIFKVSPQGNAVFVGNRGRLAKIIRFENGAVQVTSVDHLIEFDAEFSADGEQLIVHSGSHHRRQERLNVRTGKIASTAELSFNSDPRSQNGRLMTSPSGKYMTDFRLSGSSTEIYSSTSARPIRSLPSGHYTYDEPTLPCAFSQDDTKFCYFAYEKPEKGGPSLVCFDLVSGDQLWKKTISGPIGGIFFSADSQQVTAMLAQRFPVIMILNATTGHEARATITSKTEVSGAERPAHSPDRTLVAYPCGNEVRVLDLATGELKGKLTNPAQNAARVAFLRDDQLISLSHDGSIRLWGLRRQELLGTMTFAKEGTDWAFVHPSGRFEATEGSQELMYFVQGTKRAPLSAYFEAFHTPGLVAEVLAGNPIQPPSVELKDLIEPPSVSLKLAGSTRNLTVENAPEEVSTETVTLAIVADSPDSPISEIRLFHNGKRIEAKTRNLVVEDDDATDDKPLSPGAKRERITVTLLPGENTFRAVALNAQRTESQPAELSVEFTPPKEGPAVAGRTDGGLQLHLVIVGINTYRNPKYNLNYAVPDASAVQEILQKSSGAIFSKVNVVTLFNEKATRSAVQDAFKAAAAASGPKDVFVFYYAGHGVMTTQGKPEFFLVPHEVTQLYGADDAMREKALSSTELLSYSQQIAAQKQLFLLDACQSAGALQAVAQRGAAEEKAIAQLARASGTHWITASGSEQFATEFEKLGHGTFTYALLEALSGKADNGDGRVTVNELKAFLETQVPELTRLHKGTPQYPASYGFGQDFPVAVVK
jgi:WD40 repeat protein